MKILLNNNLFLNVQLIICIAFISLFIKANLTIHFALNHIEKEKGRALKLQQALAGLKIQYDSKNLSIKYPADFSTSPKQNKKSNGSNDLSPGKDTQKTFNDFSTKNQSKHIVDSITGSSKVSPASSLYQFDFGNNQLKISNYESIKRGAAFLNYKDPFASTVTVTETFEEIEEQPAHTKNINFECSYAIVNKDSTIDFRFVEKKNTDKQNPLDPLNYNRNFGITITGALNASSLNCIFLWTEITTRPRYAKFKLSIKNQ
ncbi:MAG: hypothetical protein ABIS01_11955 [Ferruginibacter sp.]